MSQEWRLEYINRGGEIPQCLKNCQSDKECDPRDRCDLTFGGGACLPKECPEVVDFGMLKKRIKSDNMGNDVLEFTLACHSEYILRHRRKNEAYRTHQVECRFNVTGSNHVKWVFQEPNLVSSQSNPVPGLGPTDVEATCESGECLMCSQC